jgi:hypothetical protein
MPAQTFYATAAWQITEGNGYAYPLGVYPVSSGGTVQIGQIDTYVDDDGTYNDFRMALFEFDLSSIPAGSTLNTVWLGVWVSGTSHPSATLSMNRIKPDGSVDSGNVSSFSSAGSDHGEVETLWDAKTAVQAMIGTGTYKLRLYLASNVGTNTLRFRSSGSPLTPGLVINWTAPNSPPYTPSVSISGIGSNYQALSVTGLTCNWSFSDPNGNPQGYYQIAGSNNGWASWTYDSGKISSSAARSHYTGTLAEGDWQFAIRVWDSNDTVSDWGYTLWARVDRTGPVIAAIDSAKAGNTGLTFNISGISDSLSGVTAIYAYMRNLANTAWLVEQQPASPAAFGVYYYTFPAPSDGQGSHLIRFHAVDAAGNWSAPADSTFTYDTSAPTVNGGLSPTQFSNSSSSFYVYAANVVDNLVGVSSVKFPTSRDGGAFVWRDGVFNPSNSRWELNVPISDHGSADGTYSTHVYVYDNVGNAALAGVITTYIDRVIPSYSSIDALQYFNHSSGNYTVRIYGVGDAFTGVNRVECYSTYSGSTISHTVTNEGSGTFKGAISYRGEGTTTVIFRIYDNAGNSRDVSTSFVVDSVSPGASNAIISTIKASSATASWGAYSDSSPSSGYQKTEVYFQRNSAGTWIAAGALPSASYDGVKNTYTTNPTGVNLTGLLEGVQYRIYVIQYDIAGKSTQGSVATFTTNVLPIATINNLTSSGSLYNQKPVIRVVGSDSNLSNIVFQLEIDDNSDFSSPIVSTIADNAGSNAGWSVKSSQVTGSSNYYTPQVSLGTGTRYARVRVYDVVAQEWGNWSSVTFTISSPSWSTTVSAGDTGVRKETVNDLRDRVNKVRTARGLSQTAFTDTLTSNVTNVRAVHLAELRAAVNEIFTTALGTSAPTYTDPNVVTNSTLRKGTHWLELRALIEASL